MNGYQRFGIARLSLSLGGQIIMPLENIFIKVINKNMALTDNFKLKL